MPALRRVLSLWFPRLSAERVMRREGLATDAPMAVLRDTGNMQVIHSMNAASDAQGLSLGQPMRDAMAMCPDLVTRLANLPQDAAFLALLRRWAGQFSPWVGQEAPSGLVIDLTGCAHLFGGEEALIDRIETDCAGFGLSVSVGIADTVGAAWALARYAGQEAQATRTGDAIDQEARATRARAAKRRHWERGGARPRVETAQARTDRIAPSGKLRQVLSPLPLSALRLPGDTVTALARVGLRRIEDILGMPRAALARRYGHELMKRLDQALGLVPEPVSPARPINHFAVRLTLPEPIGLEADVVAAIDKLLPPLTQKLHDKGRGARRVRLQLFRTDETSQSIEVALARPSWDADRIRPLLLMRLGDVDAGFGIDLVRFEVLQSEPVSPHQHKGHLQAHQAVTAQLANDTGLDDLIGRIGARVGLEQITRVHPAASHIPEKSFTTLAAAWSDPAEAWSKPSLHRPLVIFPPEVVQAEQDPFPPQDFRWRGRRLRRVAAVGPERISPEWWLDDPAWRSGVRDYWRVEVDTGERLWLYFAHGGSMSGGWFCQGAFG